MREVRKTRRARRRESANSPTVPLAAQPHVHRNLSRALLLLILAFAAFLRLDQFAAFPPGLYPDEAMNGSNALEVLETGHFQVFYPENNGREGLYIDIAAVFVHFLGNRAWVLRLPAAIFGILTVWGVYFLAAELFSRPVGLLASFFVATSFWHMNFSRMAFRAIAAPFFLAWGLYFLLAGVRRARARQPFTGMMLLAGLVYGLGFYTYIPYRITPVLAGGILIYYLIPARREKWLPAFWSASACFAAASALIAAPLAVYFLRHPGTFFGRVSQVSVLLAPQPLLELLRNAWRTARMFFVKGDPNWRHNVAWRAEVFWPVAILFALGIAIGAASVYAVIRRRSKPEHCFPYAVALGWLVAATIPVVLSNEGMPHALRSILMIPPVFILAAAGAHEAYLFLSRKVPGTLLAPAAALFFLILCWEPYHTYFDLWAVNPNVPEAFNARAVDLAGRIDALPRETAKYVAVADRGVPVHGIPMPAQTVMFLTRSYTQKEQDETHIHYLAPADGGVAGIAFCRQVAASLRGVKVFCLY